MISDEIRRYMLDAYARGESPTIMEVCSHFKCSRRTAQYARAALLRNGEIPAGIIRKGGRPRVANRVAESSQEVPKFDNETTLSTMVQRVLSGESTPLTTDQQRALLSELILHSPNHAIKVAAQNSLTKLDAQSGSGTSYAPAAPMTAEQKTARLSLLMKACGFHVVKQALQLAFPRAVTLPDLVEENASAETD